MRCKTQTGGQLLVLGACWLSICLCPAVGAAAADDAKAVEWKDALRQKMQWYASPEARQIADNLLLYQYKSGGWTKNTDMGAILSDADQAALLEREDGSTIDNGATYTQLIYLARVYAAQPVDRHRDAFLKGLDYLLEAQYPNGGWPQYYPKLTGYYKHITYNDDAMVRVMQLLREVAAGKHEYSFVDQQRRDRSLRAVSRGVGCILKTQIVVDGQKTVWCAQHDEVTLLPAAGRAYELVSLSGSESVGIVRFLMAIENPSPDVVAAINSAAAWFEKSKLTGIKWISKPDPAMLRGFDRIVVKDEQAGPLWARFYEIGTNRPIFVGRDGRVKYDVAEIEDERRNGYAWYVNSAASLLSKDYPSWLQRQHSQ